MTNKEWWNQTLAGVDLSPLSPTELPTASWYWKARWFDVLWRKGDWVRLYRPAVGWPFFGYLQMERK